MGGSESEEENRQVTRVIDVESDLWHDDEENIVPIMTDISKLPPHKGPYPPNEYTDKLRYSDWEALHEEIYYVRHRLPKYKQTIVNNHSNAEKVCGEVISYIEKYRGSQFINIGLDTEKEQSKKSQNYQKKHVNIDIPS